MPDTCKSCGHEMLTEKERVHKHLRQVMNGKGPSGAHFYNTLQGLEDSDYWHDEMSQADMEALREACSEYDQAIGEAFTAFGKVLVAAGIPLEEAQLWVSGKGGEDHPLKEMADILRSLNKKKAGV